MTFLYAPLAHSAVVLAWTVVLLLTGYLDLGHLLRGPAAHLALILPVYLGGSLFAACVFGADTTERTARSCIVWGVLMGIVVVGADAITEVPLMRHGLYVDILFEYQSLLPVLWYAMLTGAALLQRRVAAAPAQFAVIYRWTLVEGTDEKAFVAAWRKVTEVLRDTQGGLGSRLHKTSDGSWLAYACWPDRAAWESAEVTTEEGESASAVMNAAIATREESIILQPVQDLLVP